MPTSLNDITNPLERQAFLTLTEDRDPAERLRLADAFLASYPQSWVLAQAYAIAANAAIAVGLYQRALGYASASLKILPENPILLVSLANLQAQAGLFDPAENNGRLALEELDRFITPAAVPEQEWPQVKQQLRATCYFALGRAEVSQGLAARNPADRDRFLHEAIDDLARARECDPRDAEIPYLAGLAYSSLDQAGAAAAQFAAAYRLGGPLQSKAHQQLEKLYSTNSARTKSLEDFIAVQPELKPEASVNTPVSPAPPLPEYAGSETCRECHADIYEQWSHTGMAKMFRPYRPENVIGDFTNQNKYYDEPDAPANGSALPGAPPPKLFARMVIDQGRHYFEIQQSSGWHRYPVDYTIGSKWEQAYATRLPNGEIHVFPVQYNLVLKRWINFWKTLDAPGSPRTDLAQWENLDIYTSYQANCAVCHTSQLRNTKNGDLAANGLEFREPGIDCEMCHGPSSRHVAAMHGGASYEKRAGDPPVDFSKVTASEFIAICAQCHEQTAARHAGPHGELNYSTAGQFYQHYLQRPLVEFTRKAFYKDGRLRATAFIVEDLERSECFKKGNVTCGSCHDPHGADAASNPTSLKFRSHPDQMCLQCHAQFGTKAALEGHTHHPAASEGSRCASCHMPRIMDALMFKARSHQIDEIPDAEMTARFGEEESPSACLICHQNQTASWVKDKLAAWNGRSPASSGGGR